MSPFDQEAVAVGLHVEPSLRHPASRLHRDLMCVLEDVNRRVNGNSLPRALRSIAVEDSSAFCSTAVDAPVATS
jgi:hypothetical protein